jgi:hypothetical protein
MALAAALDGLDAEIALGALESFDCYTFETGKSEDFGGWTRAVMQCGL